MYGPFVAYLNGWAVFAVIQTGSIAAVAYVFSEYVTEFVRLPEFSAPLAVADQGTSGLHGSDFSWTQSPSHSNGVVRIVSPSLATGISVRQPGSRFAGGKSRF